MNEQIASEVLSTAIACVTDANRHGYQADELRSAGASVLPETEGETLSGKAYRDYSAAMLAAISEQLNEISGLLRGIIAHTGAPLASARLDAVNLDNLLATAEKLADAVVATPADDFDQTVTVTHGVDA